MNEQTVKIDSLLSELGVYLVSKYGMSPRDAVGMVMQSSLAEEISKPDSNLQTASIEQLAAALLRETEKADSIGPGEQKP